MTLSSRDPGYSRSLLPLLLARARRTRLGPDLGAWRARLHAATLRCHRDVVRHVGKRWKLP